MVNLLASHLEYIHSADPDFRRAWSLTSPATRAAHLRTLRHLEHFAWGLNPAAQNLVHRHLNVARKLKDQFAVLPEKSFPEIPPDVWIEAAQNRQRLEALYRTELQHVSLMRRAASSPVTCYGSVKSYASVQRNILDFAAGRRELDLWDLVRFRLVASDVQAVYKLSAAIWDMVGARLVRCRNYYAQPRGDWSDPYRAVHFEIKVGGAYEPAFVELQVLTHAREAVGLMDHGLVHKRTVSYWGAQHEAWLRGVSYAANILDGL
jgi:ppGpp synthetase/RelA/SpoT-type nucleotidyltranferase